MEGLSWDLCFWALAGPQVNRSPKKLFTLSILNSVLSTCAEIYMQPVKKNLAPEILTPTELWSVGAIQHHWFSPIIMRLYINANLIEKEIEVA